MLELINIRTSGRRCEGFSTVCQEVALEAMGEGAALDGGRDLRVRYRVRKFLYPVTTTKDLLPSRNKDQVFFPLASRLSISEFITLANESSIGALNSL